MALWWYDPNNDSSIQRFSHLCDTHQVSKIVQHYNFDTGQIDPSLPLVIMSIYTMHSNLWSNIGSKSQLVSTHIAECKFKQLDFALSKYCVLPKSTTTNPSTNFKPTQKHTLFTCPLYSCSCSPDALVDNPHAWFEIILSIQVVEVSWKRELK